jgi:4-hydroxy-4-methyl-2-oxoglutarate aldolase
MIPNTNIIFKKITISLFLIYLNALKLMIYVYLNSNHSIMNKKIVLIVTFMSVCFFAYPQGVGSSAEYIKALTSQWKGERYVDGRPKVSDAILERLKNIPIEAAWGVLRNKGYQNQFEGNWTILLPEKAMTGRVVTAQFMPLRPDLDEWVKAKGKLEKRSDPPTLSWPIDALTTGDVYVADAYDKIGDGGPILGDNLGNSIYAKSKRGVIVYGSVRDPEGLKMINGFNSWTKGIDPSFNMQMMLTSINAPIRIGRATVLPGDVVLAKGHGVLFIPAHLVEDLVLTCEITQLRDEFGWQRLKEGKYRPGQIDSNWSEEIRKDFLNWVNNYPGKLPMSKTDLDNYLKERNY